MTATSLSQNIDVCHSGGHSSLIEELGLHEGAPRVSNSNRKTSVLRSRRGWVIIDYIGGVDKLE